jgi:uroporphyrin-III C-methyltransferase
LIRNAKMSKVYLVGAGPGDPELLTLKAAKVLKRAEVILYDRLVSRQVLEQANPWAEQISVGKLCGQQQQTQQRILALLLHYARQGKTVVRLKGGDPLVFGRGAEEWLFLRQQGIEVEIVVGITSATAVPGLAGIPLTFRGLSSAFVVATGHCQDADEQDWSRLASVETLVILMGVGRREAIAQSLIAAGRAPKEPVAFIERGTTSEERVVLSTLSDVAQGKAMIECPAIFVVGEVVKLRESLTAETISSNAEMTQHRPSRVLS